jgi:hypothetical protein
VFPPVLGAEDSRTINSRSYQNGLTQNWASPASVMPSREWPSPRPRSAPPGWFLIRPLGVGKWVPAQRGSEAHVCSQRQNIPEQIDGRQGESRFPFPLACSRKPFPPFDRASAGCLVPPKKMLRTEVNPPISGVSE